LKPINQQNTKTKPDSIKSTQFELTTIHKKMKTHTYQSLLLAAVIGISLQAKAVSYDASSSDSLTPSGYLNAGVSSELAPVAPSSIVASMETSVVTPASPVYVNPNPNFNAVVASTGGFNDPVGAAPLSIPEPTTLALTGFGGLIALTFVRRFGKANRA
jgi:hypothetical protein